MNLIITRGLGPSAGIPGRAGPITQGFGPLSSFVFIPPHVRTDWKWIEYARLRSIDGTDPMGLGTTRTVNVVLANLGSPTTPSCDDSPSSGGSISVPVARISSGNAKANRTRMLGRRR